MAFKAKDGKSFHNRQQMKAYDSDQDQKTQKPASQEVDSEPDGDESGMGIDEMVAQNGPADKVEIDHSDGEHKVTSHHGGKKHHSSHGSAMEAHMHGAKAAGVEEAQQEPQQDAVPQGEMSIPGDVMPFASKAQQRFLEAHPDKVGGKDKLREWEQATDFSSLPEKKKPSLSSRQLERRNG